MDDAVQRGLEFLKAHPNEPFAVREIEERLNLDPKTLASPFGRLVKAAKGGIERADATYLGTTRVYQGFKYVGLRDGRPLDHLRDAAKIKQILDQRRANGDAESANRVEETLGRILTPESGLDETIRAKDYVGIFNPAVSTFRFVYVNFTGRVDFALPRDLITEYEQSGYVEWRGELKQKDYRAAVKLTDPVSVLVAVELATRAREFTKDGSRTPRIGD